MARLSNPKLTQKLPNPNDNFLFKDNDKYQVDIFWL